MAESLIENVSDTAFWIAHYRAVESERPNALFRDPLAGRLAGERGQKIASSMPMPMMTAWTVVIRTTIIDDYIRTAILEGVDTILNLGAGLDTRPYRMELPKSLLWIEADYSQTIEYKEERLADQTPHCRLERVKIDLADVSARRDMLSQVDRRAGKLLILTEGVLPYLAEPEAASLAEDIRSLSHVALWIVDYFSPAMAKWRERGGMKQKMRNAPFKFMPVDWFGFFAQRGWRAREIRYLAQEGERLKRPIQLPLPIAVLAALRRLFASKRQREQYRKFSGYVLLEPAAIPVASGNPS